MSPTRILYFGSRTWVDVPHGWTMRQVHAYIRRHRETPFVSGLRWNAICDQMKADLDLHCSMQVVEGESDGADIAARAIAVTRGIGVLPFPVNLEVDGPWPRAGHRRNERMARDGRPVLARGFISGKVGSPLSRGSAGMLAILDRLGIPTIVHREDGVERGAP